MTEAKARIVIVDDDQEMRSLLEDFLLNGGYNVKVFSTAVEAVDALGPDGILSSTQPDGDIDVIISDMARPPDQHAGYTLLDQLRASGNLTPFVIYSGSNAPEHRAEARRRGALGATNRASELFSYVLAAINTRS